MAITTDDIGAQRPIRVLEIIGNAVIGGMETYVLRLLGGLPAAQFSVTCLCPYESRYTAQLRDAGFEVLITPIRDDPLWQSIQFTTQLIRSRGIEVVHAHLPNAHVLAGITSRLTQIPALATVHGMFVPALEVEASRLTGTHLTVVSQSAYMQALTAGIPAERLTLVSNGVDAELFSPRPRRPKFRAGLGIPDTAPLVGFVGRLAFEKGPDQFVRMAWFIRKDSPDTHFVMVGEGPMRDDIRSLIRELKLNDRVHLAGACSDMPAVYPEFDVLASTSRSEGMPLVMLEAMATGLPVVATEVGGVAEIIENGTTGWLARLNDYETIARLLTGMLANIEATRAMGRAARERVIHRFTLATSVERIAQVIRSLKSPQGMRGRANVSDLSSASAAKKGAPL